MSYGFPLIAGLALVVLSVNRKAESTMPAGTLSVLPGPSLTSEPFFDPADNATLSGEDGPYFFRVGNSLEKVEVVSSDNGYRLEKTPVEKAGDQLFLCRVDNPDGDRFAFRLRPGRYAPPPAVREDMPGKVLAISDIEGNFDAFHSLLTGNGVMDTQYRWTFGDGALVLLGDFVDRGRNVLPCLWLIYHLEEEAAKQGGSVHFILGNHEAMNLHGDIRYVASKYQALARAISGKDEPEEAFRHLMSDNSELVRWMRSKNVVEQIGDVLFVHGGISPELLNVTRRINIINRIARQNIDNCLCTGQPLDPDVVTVLGANGPLWYRGLVDYPQSERPAREALLDEIRSSFGVGRLVVGHTVVEDISADFDGKLIRIDVTQPGLKNTGKAKALLIENGAFFRVNDFGERLAIR